MTDYGPITRISVNIWTRMDAEDNQESDNNTPASKGEKKKKVYRFKVTS